MLRALGENIRAWPAAHAGAFVLAYFVGAEIGHAVSLRSPAVAVATVWPPAGLLLAVLVQTPYHGWPTLLLLACGANLASDVLLHDWSVPVSLGFCVANCGEACLGAWLLRRYVGMPFTLEHMNDVLGLASLSALISTMLGATIGAGVVMAGGNGVSYWFTWQVWWIADAVGVLAVAPVMLTWTAERIALLRAIRPWRIVEGVALFLGVIVVTQAVFGELLPPPLIVPVLVLPFLLWAALRFGPPCAATSVLVVALIAVWNTARGRGPYTIPAAMPRQQLMRAQTTLFAISLSVMALSVTVAQRKRAEKQRIKLIGELEQALNENKTLRGLIPLCAWCKKIQYDEGHWQLLEDYLRAHTEAEFTHGICPECLAKQVASLGEVGPDQQPK